MRLCYSSTQHSDGLLPAYMSAPPQQSLLLAGIVTYAQHSGLLWHAICGLGSGHQAVQV